MTQTTREAAIRSEDAPVELLGGREDVEELIARSWAVVLLSRFEGVNFAIQEAMWCGRAPIASTLPGLSWLIGDAGELVTDLASATVAIARLADHSVATSLGTRAAERIRSRITADAPWPALDALYRDHRA